MQFFVSLNETINKIENATSSEQVFNI